jgi:hypothetical protein
MLPPKIWGKHIWTSIHLIALGFPDNPTSSERKQYEAFFIEIGNVLPCPKCRVNYKEHLIELPINFYLQDNKTLFAWTVAVHNIVNRQNNKREWTFDEAYQYYINAEFDKPNVQQQIVINNDTSYKIALIVLAALLFLVVILYVKK